ncbi:MAG: hypothetical protein RSE12_16940 [Fuscovulum sp.]|nr:MAG: hypothetical protein RSE12_16940 [Fuscovulum sp.]
MASSTSIGTLFSVSTAAPATLDAAGYAALTYTQVGEITEIPEFGAEHAVVTHTPLATGVVDKQHGEVNYGSLTIPFAEDVDAGQTLLSTALANKTVISVKVAFPSGRIRYFRARVFSTRVSASTGSVVSGSAMVEIISPIVLVS